MNSICGNKDVCNVCTTKISYNEHRRFFSLSHVSMLMKRKSSQRNKYSNKSSLYKKKVFFFLKISKMGKKINFCVGKIRYQIRSRRLRIHQEKCADRFIEISKNRVVCTRILLKVELIDWNRAQYFAKLKHLSVYKI